MAKTLGLYVLFNHLFLSTDPVTYEAILKSDFLRSEFAVSETRTTVRNDYPDGYSGLYFYGQETYFEFFDAANTIFPLSSFGIASGLETKGQIEQVNDELNKFDVAVINPVVRQVDGEAVPWFSAVVGASSAKFKGAMVWAMEYDDEFIQKWLGYSSALDGSILQRDLLTSYAIKLKQEELHQRALMKDITGIDVRIEQQFLEAYRDQLKASGWKAKTHGDCTHLTSRTTNVTLCPKSETEPSGIYKMTFSLKREHSGPKEMHFGSSKLKFDGKVAEWDFQYPSE